MDNLTPITREEMLMNDEPLTPITREEKILAGEDLTPVTRREYFLKKYRHAGGDVMVEGLEVTANGTYTAPEGKAYSPVEVAVPLPDNAYLLKEASGSLVSFSDGADLPMPSFICNIDAVQDLHGYDAPWVGGAGKNKLPMTVDGIKALNTAGTWSGNAYTLNNITFTLQTNASGAVTGLNVNGTASANTTFWIKKNDTGALDFADGTSVILSGCPSGGSWDDTETYALRLVKNNYLAAFNDTGSGKTVTYDSTLTLVYIDIKSGVSLSNKMFYPMIRLATETDPTFAPYSNICPISGHTGLDAWVRGKNLCPVILSGDASNKGYTATVENDGIIIVTGTWTGTSNNVIGINEQVRFNLPAGSYILSGATVDNYNDYGVCLQIYNWNTSRAIVNTSTTEDAEFTLEAQAEISVRIFIYNSKASGKTIPSGGIKLYPMIRLATETDPTFAPYSNICPISGHTGVEANVSPTTEASAGTTYSISWQTEAGEVYGGYVDLVSGVLTATHGIINCKNLTFSTNTSTGGLHWADITGSATNIEPISNKLKYLSRGGDGWQSTIPCISIRADDGRVRVYGSLSDYGDGGTYENTMACYELATPITYQLTPTQIKSLLGNNNAWCSTGDVDIDYFTKEV